MTPFYHFSVDDCFDALIEVSDRDMFLFEHPFFAFLKELNEKFGTKVDLYLFYQKDGQERKRSLREVSERNRAVFEAHPWLCFGPHGRDPDIAPYQQPPQEQIQIFDAIYKEIERFAGRKNKSKWVRLHYFSESYELADYFGQKGVEVLLTTDKDAVSYRLPEFLKDELSTKGFVDYNNLRFVRSSIRIENLIRDHVEPTHVSLHIKPILTSWGFVAVFTHEYELSRLEVQVMTISVLHWLKTQAVQSPFAIIS